LLSANICKLFAVIIRKHPIFAIRKHPIFAIRKHLQTFRCYNPQTPDFRYPQTPNFHVLVLFAVIIRKHPIFVVWCWGNSQSPDRIFAKIVFFVAKTDFRKKI
jgi:hypothetical protein